MPSVPLYEVEYRARGHRTAPGAPSPRSPDGCLVCEALVSRRWLTGVLLRTQDVRRPSIGWYVVALCGSSGEACTHALHTTGLSVLVGLFLLDHLVGHQKRLCHVRSHQFP